jgi:ketosteroid isomerase-like protein
MNDATGRARSVGIPLAIATLAAVALIFLASRRAENRAPERAEDQIRMVLNDQVDAWNRGDLDGFMAGYWNSDELLFCSGGTITKGWKPTLDRYRKRYQAEGKEMGRLTFADIHVEPLTNEVALVRGRWLLALKSSQPDGLFTLKLVRFADGWRVVYDHTSASEPK